MTTTPPPDPSGMSLPLIASYPVGRMVECDSCGMDLADDPRSGGIMFGSSVYGPCCVERQLASIAGYGEEDYITGRCPEGISFADWIRDLRGPDATVRIYGSNPEMTP